MSKTLARRVQTAIQALVRSIVVSWSMLDGFSTSRACQAVRLQILLQDHSFTDEAGILMKAVSVTEDQDRRVAFEVAKITPQKPPKEIHTRDDRAVQCGPS